ncbi:unnamed protein product [Prorocentrum cordatum]|uniref:Protein kinase domain-containing protein n=1 Tax=Prorocentrum cordatum TaxID=2364126 RepID=A0ABN9UF89_9DINO|nr:unnamed protein product [Polarella glacialis]
MWLFRTAEIELPPLHGGHGQLVPIDTSIDTATLRFCHGGIERGFVRDRMPSLVFKFRVLSALVGFMACGSLVLGACWEQGQFPTAEENRTQLFITTAVSCILVTATAMFAVTFILGWALGSNYLALEVIVVVSAVIVVMAHTFAMPWYAARVLGFDPSALGTSFGPMTETRMVLAINLFVTGTHFVLPVRFYVLISVEVASVLCYTVPTLALGGPEMEYAPLTLMFLMSLVVMAAFGKRSQEYQERTQFVRLIREKSLRFQSEFELSQHVWQPSSWKASSEHESRPSSTETARAFMLASCSVQQLIPIGEKEGWLIPLDELSFHRPSIGEGMYGRVYSGLCRGHPVAIKVPKMRPYERMTEGQAMQFCNELQILRKLRHPNIVFFYGACIGEQQSQLALILEFVTGCSLRQFILCEHPAEQQTTTCVVPEPPTDVERAHVLVGISSAVRYLHTRSPRVVHGDLKSSNVFVERACCPRRSPAAKLLDFGLSRALTRSAKPLGGTLRWVAPEVLSGSSPDTAADVFSFGCLTLFVTTGKQPGSANATRPPHRTSLLVGSWLARACEQTMAECCSADASSRPDMQRVHQAAQRWLEEMLLRQEQPVGPLAGTSDKLVSGSPSTRKNERGSPRD